MNVKLAVELLRNSVTGVLELLKLKIKTKTVHNQVH